MKGCTTYEAQVCSTSRNGLTSFCADLVEVPDRIKKTAPQYFVCNDAGQFFADWVVRWWSSSEAKFVDDEKDAMVFSSPYHAMDELRMYIDDVLEYPGGLRIVKKDAQWHPVGLPHIPLMALGISPEAFTVRDKEATDFIKEKEEDLRIRGLSMEVYASEKEYAVFLSPARGKNRPQYTGQNESLSAAWQEALDSYLGQR